MMTRWASALIILLAVANVGAEDTLRVFIYDVKVDGAHHYFVSILDPDRGFAEGLPHRAIVGEIRGPAPPSEPDPDQFVENAEFVAMLHRVVAEQGPSSPALRSAAAKHKAGWIYVLDARTPDPSGTVPPEDIIGAFPVADGSLISNGYQPNSNFRLLGANGFLQFVPDLTSALTTEATSPSEAPQ